jgi:negative regulator of sigma-B (phosphoserine phosphatase)
MAQEALIAPAAAFIEWASAARAFEDEPESGDRSVVAELPGGMLLAVIDGLGHGMHAAAAADAAATAIEADAEQPLAEILRRCHAASLGTRGCAITLATIDLDSATLTWSGVGNVAGVVLHRAPTPIRKLIRGRAGIVGSRLPRLHSETLKLDDGDVILLASDGIRPDFGRVATIHLPLQRIADEILAEQALPTDDALVLVARYHGPST